MKVNKNVLSLLKNYFKKWKNCWIIIGSFKVLLHSPNMNLIAFVTWDTPTPSHFLPAYMNVHLSSWNLSITTASSEDENVAPFNYASNEKAVSSLPEKLRPVWNITIFSKYIA